MIGLILKPLSICQWGWREIRNALPVIRWVRWGPRIRISALFRRRYLPRINYVCDAGYLSCNPLYSGYHILFCIVPVETTLAFSSLPILCKDVYLCLISNYSSNPNGVWVNSPWGRIQLAGQKYQDRITLTSKTRFSRHCFGFQSWRFSLLVAYNM